MTDPASVTALIDRLARETGAPESFVHGVRDLFRRKGIDLDGAAEPYAEAIVDTFRREARIRSSSRSALAQTEALERQFALLGEIFRSRIAELLRVRDLLTEHLQILERARGSGDVRKPERPKQDRQGGTAGFLVPGPGEVQ